jgi:drug/metabolite transporter (DMT)-like permease
MYEHRSQPMLPRRAFLKRLSRHALISIGIVLGSLLFGLLGYHFFGRLPWIDALVNASMLLGGMGPVDALTTVPGKLFASFYALYSGIVFLLAAGIIFAPIFHRILHHFHLESGSDDSDGSAGTAS